MSDKEPGILLKLLEMRDMLTRTNRSEIKRKIYDKCHFELETVFANIKETTNMKWDIFEQAVQLRRIIKTELTDD